MLGEHIRVAVWFSCSHLSTEEHRRNSYASCSSAVLCPLITFAVLMRYTGQGLLSGPVVQQGVLPKVCGRFTHSLPFSPDRKVNSSWQSKQLLACN